MPRLYRRNIYKGIWHLRYKQKAKNIDKIAEKVVSLPD